jgi:hypothetical protein
MIKHSATAFELIGNAPVSLSRLTGVLREFPEIVAWCQVASRGLDLPSLASTLIEQLPQLLGVSIEDYLVKRWAKAPPSNVPASVHLKIEPRLELIEVGAVTLTVSVEALIELRAIDSTQQIFLNPGEIVFSVGADWKIQMQLYVVDATTHRLFHATAWQPIAMPMMFRVESIERRKNDGDTHPS